MKTNKMNIEQIRAWCSAKLQLGYRTVYEDDKGRKVVFADGSTYEWKVAKTGYSTQRCEVVIDGVLVNVTNYKYEDFRFRPVAA